MCIEAILLLCFSSKNLDAEKDRYALRELIQFKKFPEIFGEVEKIQIKNRDDMKLLNKYFSANEKDKLIQCIDQLNSRPKEPAHEKVEQSVKNQTLNKKPLDQVCFIIFLIYCSIILLFIPGFY